MRSFPANSHRFLVNGTPRPNKAVGALYSMASSPFQKAKGESISNEDSSRIRNAVRLSATVLFTRASDIIVPDHLTISPAVPVFPYRDGFGNWFVVKNLAIYLGVGASALLVCAASAAPLSAEVSVAPESNIQNVRMVCNEDGRWLARTW